jgi:phage terminase large subunit GpA-like protein
MSQIVYAFCGGRGWQSTFPCKGAKVIIADKEKREVGDVPGSIYKRWRALQIGDADQTLYEINTQHYKKLIYSKLNTIPRRPMEPQANGFIDTPLQYGDEYFAQLTAEEQLGDGSFKKVRERNEALDTFVYAMCAADVYLMSVIEILRKQAKAAGNGQAYCDAIRSPQALNYIEHGTII